MGRQTGSIRIRGRAKLRHGFSPRQCQKQAVRSALPGIHEDDVICPEPVIDFAVCASIRQSITLNFVFQYDDRFKVIDKIENRARLYRSYLAFLANINCRFANPHPPARVAGRLAHLRVFQRKQALLW